MRPVDPQQEQGERGRLASSLVSLFLCPRRALQGHAVHHLGPHHPEHLWAQ